MFSVCVRRVYIWSLRSFEIENNKNKTTNQKQHAKVWPSKCEQCQLCAFDSENNSLQRRAGTTVQHFITLRRIKSELSSLNSVYTRNWNISSPLIESNRTTNFFYSNCERCKSSFFVFKLRLFTGYCFSNWFIITKLNQSQIEESICWSQ